MVAIAQVLVFISEDFASVATVTVWTLNSFYGGNKCEPAVISTLRKLPIYLKKENSLNSSLNEPYFKNVWVGQDK